MLKRKGIVRGTKTFEREENSNNDIIAYSTLHGIDFSDLDFKSKDKLINEICKRILKLEQEKNE